MFDGGMADGRREWSKSRARGSDESRRCGKGCLCLLLSSCFVHVFVCLTKKLEGE